VALDHQPQFDDLGGTVKPPPRPSLFGRFTMLLNIIGTLLIIAMGIAVNADVLGRDLFNHPVPGVFEFLGLSIVSVVFLQMANTLREDRHVANDIILSFVSRTHPRVAHAFYGLFHIIGAALMLLIVWFVWPMFVENYEQGYFKGTTNYVEIPIWPFMATVVIGGIATAIQYFILAARQLSRAFAPTGAPEG